MELLDTIHNRRSIRKFTVNQIPKQIIEDLINCARLAPSSKNRQPCHFIDLRGQKKNEIAQLMVSFLDKNQTDENQLIYASIRQTATIITEVSDLILVLRKKDDLWRYSDALSIGAAIEHIFLRAVDLWLGTLWIGDMTFIQETLMSMLAYEGYELASAIAFGYPAESPKARPRKNISEILEWVKE